jgi:hypothetical protein
LAGKFPYLNPIENLWSIIKGQLKKRENITSLPLLIKAIKEIWVTLSKPLMIKLAHSMPTRIKMCLENGGQMTNTSQNVIFFMQIVPKCQITSSSIVLCM